MRFRTKLLLFNLSIVFGLTLLAVILGWDFLRLADLPAQERGIVAKAQSNIRQLARVSETALVSPDLKGIDRLLAGYVGDTDLAFLQIWDRRNKLVGILSPDGQVQSMKRALAGEPGEERDIGDAVISAWMPVKIEGVRLGSVAIGYSLKRIQLAQRRVVLFMVIVGLVALLSAVVSFLFSARVTQPVLRMTRAFRRMADGDLEQPKVLVKSRDETGEMARAFNHMLSTMQELGTTAREVAQGNLSITITAKGDLADAFREMVGMLRELSEKAREITQGNLGVVITAKGDLATAFRDMLLSLRELVNHIAETVQKISSAAAQILSAARQQEQGATEQSSAVEETQRTMEALLRSARDIAHTSQSVLENAEMTHSNNQLIAERISQLSSHMQRIAETLEVIKSIANKSDLLALNASLEGTRAGEAGRGFSLVAAQMQRLAENVMDSVANIKALTADIRETTTATVLAIEEGGKLASSTTQSARQISLVTQQQQSGTEQVTQAMNEVAEIARQTVEHSRQATSATEELTRLADRLQDRLKTFQLTRGASRR